MTTPSTQARPRPNRPNRLEQYRPLVLRPHNWAELLRDDHPVGGILDFWRG